MSLHFCIDPFIRYTLYRKKKEKMANVCMKHKLVITTIIKKSTTSHCNSDNVGMYNSLQNNVVKAKAV